MRGVLLPGVILALVGTTNPAAWQTRPREVRITITPSRGGAIGTTAPLSNVVKYADFPQAGVATQTPGRGSLPDVQFGINAWNEGDNARVVVYAMLVDKRAPHGWTATPISTFLLAPGKALEVKETMTWGGTPVLIGSEVQVR